MRLLRHIFAVVLLALWLPATLHCGLEAAGLFDPHEETTCADADSCCDAASASCERDACELLEQSAYKPSSDLLKAPPPQLAACVSILCFQLLERDLTAPSAPSVVALDKPLAWVPTWHFSRRAAPMSRAPSIIAA